MLSLITCLLYLLFINKRIPNWVLLKIEAILWDILKCDWPEFKLLMMMKQFVLLAFKTEYNYGETKKFEILSNTIMEMCISPNILNFHFVEF